MKTSIIIPSLGRPYILGECLSRLSGQTKRADQILVVVPGAEDLPDLLPEEVTVVHSAPGSAQQRNVGIDHSAADANILLFMDDDTFLHRDYLANMEKIFAAHADVAGLSGILDRDGDTRVEEADALLQGPAPACDAAALLECDKLYGCNFGVRKVIIQNVRFDERFVLYGWLEDADFCLQLQAFGRMCYSGALRCVHLQYSSGGRANHCRFGFSQVMNPLYLCRKHKHPVFTMMKEHWFRGVPANIYGSVFGPDRANRRARLNPTLTVVGHIRAPAASGWSVDQGVGEWHRGFPVRTHRYMALPDRIA